MITIGKNNDLHSKRQVFAYVTKEDVAKKLFDEISPNMLRETADIQELSRSVLAEATQQKWQLFS